MGSTCRLRREPQASLTARRERPCRQRLGIPIGCHHETSGDGMGNSGAVAGRVMARRIGPRRSGRPQEIRNPLFARVYDHVLSRGESARMVGYRQQLLEGLAGKVIEIGPGNGPNFPHYPPAVAEVVAVEPEPYLRARAQRAAHQARSQVSVIDGDADHLPAENASVDAVVVCQVLCSVPDQTGALREILRVLKPGGQLRVFEHVDAEHPLAHTLLKAAEVTFWRRAFGNCHPTRDTLTAISQAGFDTRAVRRFVMQAGPAEPPLPYIHGTALAPSQRHG